MNKREYGITPSCRQFIDYTAERLLTGLVAPYIIFVVLN
jgi:hypothetical protein